ncbi:MAG: winged helix-turn-helix transcriptional regulator [Clostridiales bacterium]|nr:winged helix-turn-helix transcriptional regulator [Clostridiales bacterium]
MDLHALGKRIMLLQLLRRRLMHGQNCERDIVPGQYPLLNYLSNHPDATQQELAAMLFVSPASVAQSTKRLQSARLLEKASDPENLRKNRLRVTPAGQEVVNNFRTLADSVDRQTFLGFSEEEKAQLLDMLNRMIKNIATDEDMAMLAATDDPVCHNHP